MGRELVRSGKCICLRSRILTSLDVRRNALVFSKYSATKSREQALKEQMTDPFSPSEKQKVKRHGVQTEVSTIEIRDQIFALECCQISNFGEIASYFALFSSQQFQDIHLRTQKDLHSVPANDGYHILSDECNKERT